jgi:hypothetical protein
VLNPALPNFQGPCWFTLDPASLLITSHFNPVLREELPPEMLEFEYYGDDVYDLASAARSESGVASILRGDWRRPELEPALAGERRDGRRPGADRDAANAHGRVVGNRDRLSRTGRTDVLR